MNSNLALRTRALLLVAGAMATLMVIVVGLNAINLGRQVPAYSSTVQGALLLLIGASCLVGVALSAFAPHRLQDSPLARKLLGWLAFSLPAIEVAAMQDHAERAVISHTLVALIVASVISLSIASAWIPAFQSRSGQQ